jgi:hypothetical protein
MSMERPEFLKRQHANGHTIVEEFRKISAQEACEVDRWLLINSQFGSLTWPELFLVDWINEDQPQDRLATK